MGKISQVTLSDDDKSGMYPDNGTDKIENSGDKTPLLATLLYKPLIIGGFLIRITDNIRLFEPAQEGGGLILINYISISLLYTACYLIFYAIIRMELSPDTYQLGSFELKGLYTNFYRLLLLASVFSYYIGLLLLSSILRAQPDGSSLFQNFAIEVFRLPFLLVPITIGISLIFLTLRNSIKSYLDPVVFEGSNLLVDISLYQLLIIFLIVPIWTLDNFLSTIIGFTEIPLLIFIFILVLAVLLLVTLIVGKKLVPTSTSNNMPYTSATASIAMTFVMILILLDFVLLSSAVLDF